MSERFYTLARRVIARMSRAHRAREIEQELAFHSELLARDFRATGLSHAEASDASAQRLGNRTRIAEASWDALGFGAVDTLIREFRFAWRAIRRSPGFSLTVVLTLALGIGATATIFSVIDHVLLRPLAYPDAGRLVELFEHGSEGNWRMPSLPTFQDWARSPSGLTGMAYVRGDLIKIETRDGAKTAAAGYVSLGFFKLIGTRPELGRTFAAEEELPSGTDVIVLSHSLWASMFGSDPHVIGRVVTVDSGRATIIGVMPSTFSIPDFAQLWRPLGQILDRDPALKSRDFHTDSRIIGRLLPVVSTAQAARLLSATQRRISQDYPREEGQWIGVDVDSLGENLVGGVRAALWALGAAVVLMLLIACVNLANLSAVRGALRGREMAIRVSLGASRLQVMRQVLVEMLTLCLVGGTIGVLASIGAVKWLRATAPFDLPRASEMTIDARSLLVAMAVTAFTAIVFTVLPAVRAAGLRGSANRELLGSRSDTGTSLKQSRARSLLTCVQFALAIIMVVGTGLLIHSYQRLENVKLGFDSRDVLSRTIFPPKPKYAAEQDALSLYLRIVERLRAVPGVTDAAAVNFFPLGRAGVATNIELPDRVPSSQDIATYVTATEDYLRAMRIPLKAGRWFSPDEMRSPTNTVVISETVARKYWPGADAVGKPITIFRSSQGRPGFGQPIPSTVIGVVGDVRQYGVDTDLDPAVYVPLSAEPWPWLSLVVRVHSASPVIAASLQRALGEVEPAFVVGDPREGLGFVPVANSLSTALAPRRYVIGIVGAFGSCAILLAAIGIFGVTSYTVARGTRELGLRLALGATPRTIVRAVLVRTMAPALVGCALGIAGALALVRLVEHLLFDTSPTDPLVFLTSSILLLAVGFVACYFPARRAGRVDPAIALASD
ncbi:MAG: ABC transporter permease [Gemmatimonadaceae bacterium]|nr:ABC transporter permease [Gemmatimonadaceae bacterium]